ncbi:Wzy polymerase domain-containing protein [Pseudomonas sp. MBLB4123]|uniref:PglL family O-oligosaccharyltransferase n=1 Tax=Pseudomonas sp. MBLB4123 TaxID=3451557 RepID=UPI003F750A38
MLSAIAFLVAWLLPNHYSPWAVAYQEFAVFLAGILLVSTMLRVGGRLSPALIGFLLLPVIPLLQMVFGVIYFAGDALIVSLYLFGFALMLQVGYSFPSGSVNHYFFVRSLAGLFVVGGVLSTWIALHQWLQLPSTIWVADLPFGARPYANIGQPNNMATLLCMGLAGGLYLYERRLLNPVTAGLLACFLLFGVALTGSRAPWLAAIAVIVFWGVKSRMYAPRLSVRGLLAWVGVYLACLSIIGWFSESGVGVARVGSVNERINIWVQLWQEAWRGPWWGYGWNQVPVAQMQGALNYSAPALSLNGHNILLDLMIWNGPLLGGVIFFAIATWLARIAWRVSSAESMFALVAAGFVLAHAVVEFPYEHAYLLFPLGLLLGVAATDGGQGREFTTPRWLTGVALFVCVGLFGCFWKEYRIIEEDHRLLRMELARVGQLKAAQPAPDVHLLSQLREFIRFVRTPPNSHMSRAELERMRKVVYRYPSISGLLRYVVALGINGQVLVAREQLTLFKRIYGPGQRGHVQAMFELQEMQKQYPELFEY